MALATGQVFIHGVVEEASSPVLAGASHSPPVDSQAVSAHSNFNENLCKLVWVHNITLQSFGFCIIIGEITLDFELTAIFFVEARRCLGSSWAFGKLLQKLGLIVTASQGSDSLYNYNTVTVVLFTEILKLIVSTALYYKDNSLSSLVHDLGKHSKVLLLYFVPAFLYCLYNNLAFVNLSAFDPTTYYLLLQFRVVVTGIVFQVLFQKKLSGKQWLSLILLTVGCMVKQIDISSLYSSSTVSPTAHSNSLWEFRLSVNALLILVQKTENHNVRNSTPSIPLAELLPVNELANYAIACLYCERLTVCSCCAGVFNEYLLKGEGANVNIYIQNMFMYIDSIVCNAGILLIKGDLYDAFTPDALSSVFAYKVIIIMFNNAAIGIITSFFLKNLNSILKTFASALELMFTAVLCWLLFGIPIYANTMIAISIVSYAVILYSQNPVVNKIKGNIPPEMKPFLSKNGPENV
ncbi:unnamed protein product [Timema podura]|uniref:CMP-sialic acid transporter n=1 Tax=Timema podura TaxID=61482 RepID=A0ABN7NCL0_TIMPD|nr:unnamed protein product [Timema podura]